MPTTYEPIQTYTLGSAAASIDFTSIGSAYTDLRIVLTGTSSTGNSIRARFNSDSGTNYSTTILFGNGSSATTSQSTGLAHIFITNGSSTTIPLMATLDIFSYAGSTFKTSLATQSRDENGSGVVGNSVQLWRNTAAITNISLFLSSGNLQTGTIATLYGIKNA
jgi:hypothetical protein